MKRPKRKQRRLPTSFRRLFWDHNFRNLSWRDDQDLITARILSCGSWADITWLRKRLGDDRLRQWIVRREGRNLSPRQLRFWEVILGLPHRQVSAWLASQRRAVWDKRSRA
ncbi:MAG TPA: hypothetical protein VGY58_05370 [Gemmataceae bacterium]|nr:hypothetical protein [Gemmataceae bacterium]